MSKPTKTRIKNLVVISDTHAGCRYGLCPPEITLDGGAVYKQSKHQAAIWEHYQRFIEWIDHVRKGEPYILIHNGDALEGVHHRATTQISQNASDQINIAEQTLRPLRDNAEAYYHVRGTEAHVGPSAEMEEILANRLGAKRDRDGMYSRWELWLEFGDHASLAHFSHHIGTTSSENYESTAVMKELISAYVTAGQWRGRPPDIVVRSHRHRSLLIEIPSASINAIAMVTAGWQLKTPFAHRIQLGRSALPQIGGHIIREGEEVPVYARKFILPVKTYEIEKV